MRQNDPCNYESISELTNDILIAYVYDALILSTIS